MKQEQDKYTVDAFSAPRRGRPPVLHPLTNAQRQARYRKKIKQGTSDPVVQAKSHASLLKSIAKKISVMASDWRDVDQVLMSQLEQLSISLSDIEQQMTEFVAFDGRFD